MERPFSYETIRAARSKRAFAKAVPQHNLRGFFMQRGDSTKYLKQFLLILAISFVGEGLHAFIPLPIPASIYGILILFLCLQFHVLSLHHVKETARFLIEIMPVMFIPAAVELIETGGGLKTMLLSIVVSVCVVTVLVMVVSGHATQFVIRKERKNMKELLTNSVFFGAFVSLAAYEIGVWVKKKSGWAICNPLLIAIILVIGVLLALQIPYDVYEEGAQYISYLLTPATVCLAVPLYEQVELLRKHKKAIAAGLLAGMLTSLLSILLLAALFRLNHEEYVTLLPKSITTAIGMGVSEELGGLVTVTVAVIIMTGVVGNIVAESVCRLFRLEEPVAKGIAIGSASHAIGTAKAMEMGEVEGAMSSLSIAVTGLITVAGAALFAGLW